MVSVLTYCAAFYHSNLCKVCAVTPASFRSARGNAHPVIPRLAHRGRRSALDEQIRTPQWALDLLHYFRQRCPTWKIWYDFVMLGYLLAWTGLLKEGSELLPLRCDGGEMAPSASPRDISTIIQPPRCPGLLPGLVLYCIKEDGSAWSTMRRECGRQM